MVKRLSVLIDIVFVNLGETGRKEGHSVRGGASGAQAETIFLGGLSPRW
jgi:hypothetical protein